MFKCKSIERLEVCNRLELSPIPEGIYTKLISEYKFKLKILDLFESIQIDFARDDIMANVLRCCKTVKKSQEYKNEPGFSKLQFSKKYVTRFIKAYIGSGFEKFKHE